MRSRQPRADELGTACGSVNAALEVTGSSCSVSYGVAVRPGSA